MSQRELEIEISPTGKVTVKTIGIKGKECIDVAESVVRNLGIEERRELTMEYYESELHNYNQQHIRDRFQ